MAKKRVVIMNTKEVKKEVEKAEKEKTKLRLSNRAFAETNEEFRNACEAITVITGTVKGASRGDTMNPLEPTARQASKYRRKRGLAFTKGLPLLSPKALKKTEPEDTKGEALDSGHEANKGGEKDVNDEAKSEAEEK